MISDAREILKQLYNCCDLIGEMVIDGEKTERDLRKLLLTDTVLFTVRVSANGTITETEAAFLNALTGKENTPETWRGFAAEKEKSDASEIFFYFVRADGELMRRHKNFSRGASMSESLYRFFCAVGDALVQEKLCTEESVQAETERLSSYLKTTGA